MIVEISIAASAAAFVALVVFLIITLHTARKTIKQTHKTLSEIQRNVEGLTDAGIELMDDIDDLTRDMKKKSEALNVFFRPFEHKKESKHESQQHDRLTDILECLAQGILLFNKIKEEVKEYVKSR